MNPGPKGRSSYENLLMGETPSRELQVHAIFLVMLFSCLKNRSSKGWERRVPAAAVIPAARVVVTITEPKASAAGLVNPWVNRTA